MTIAKLKSHYSPISIKKYMVTALCFTIVMCFMPKTLFAKTDTSPVIIPIEIPVQPDTHKPFILHNGTKLETTLVPELQQHIKRWIKQRSSPIAAVVMAEVKTGKILLLAQGMHPTNWNVKQHTALHPGFPSASLFKTVVTAAAIETAQLDPKEPIGLIGGCGKVHARGGWLRQEVPKSKFPMNLSRAYGHSCNGFFAKIAINQVGLGAILSMAERFGWNGKPTPADFLVPPSPMKPPNPYTSSTHTVGKFAAGFGYVGISAMHATWQMLAIANNGQSKPLQLIKNQSQVPQEGGNIISPETADTLRSTMDATTLGGTASFAFKRGKYRKLRYKVGGKTGTLTGYSPSGLTTWFSGIMPLDNPEVVVAAVVVIEDLWKFKSPQLAAEALMMYDQLKRRQKRTAKTTSQKKKAQR
ncbi:MAG: hypothetical protein CMP10_06080 [Zetaproteobacteria bacterium]|nr:hypothetical protein [Pseudobdellovibrionaceae bacterium]